MKMVVDEDVENSNDRIDANARDMKDEGDTRVFKQ